MLVDEGLAYLWVANDIGESNPDITGLHASKWEKLQKQGKPLAEVLQGYWVTAKLDIKFLKPVPCPGIVGIETELVEKKANRMRMRATMKDEKGVPLLQADGVWVKIGGGSTKL
ncbi:hypothetical protein GQ44DRAFT_700278 [Phaeosphaeriaceae sp. PMI808]|nr:hypothetical protein GQ44DRAFT_700278 [Phaeosphaeriaceae sp. PMI808]